MPLTVVIEFRDILANRDRDSFYERLAAAAILDKVDFSSSFAPSIEIILLRRIDAPWSLRSRAPVGLALLAGLNHEGAKIVGEFGRSSPGCHSRPALAGINSISPPTDQKYRTLRGVHLEVSPGVRMIFIPNLKGAFAQRQEAP